MTAAPVDTITGEVLDRDGARRRANRIRGSLEATWQLVVEAYQARDWLALGYDTWDEYCRLEFGTSRIAIPKEERAETIGSLRDAGLSVRAIASATGRSVGAVHGDLQQVFRNEQVSEDTEAIRSRLAGGVS